MIFSKTIALIGGICILLTSTPIAYEEIPYIHKMHATAYCNYGDTCTGIPVREGIAAASKLYLGKTAIVYQRLPDGSVGKIIGIFEVEDTGGTEGILNGNVIDIWCSDKDACQEFMNKVYEDGCKGKVFVEFVNAEG